MEKIGIFEIVVPLLLIVVAAGSYLLGRNREIAQPPTYMGDGYVSEEELRNLPEEVVKHIKNIEP